LGVSQCRFGRGDEEKNFQPLLGLEPSITQPVAQRNTAELSQIYLYNGSCITFTINSFSFFFISRIRPMTSSSFRMSIVSLVAQRFFSLSVCIEGIFWNFSDINPKMIEYRGCGCWFYSITFKEPAVCTLDSIYVR
jgi:hypothetical protein